VLERLVERPEGSLAVLVEQCLDSSKHAWKVSGQDLAGKDVDGRVLAASADIDVRPAVPFSGVEVQAVPGDRRPPGTHPDRLRVPMRCRVGATQLTP
jgi:hypothetical protein